MTFEAQMTLSNMAFNGPTKNKIFYQFSCKVQQIYPINSAYYSTYFIAWIRKKNAYWVAFSLYSEVRPATMLFQTKNGDFVVESTF